MLQMNMLSFVVFSFMPFGVVGSYWIMKDKMLASAELYGEVYAETINNLVTSNILIAIIVSTIIGAVIGSYIGKALLKKHFERAGIV